MSCAKCSLPCTHQPSVDWWSPGQILFCSAQVQFLLANYGSLRATRWPTKPSGYIDTHEDVQQSMHENITWQTIIEVRSELNLRMVKLPFLMQNIIFDRRINWEQKWNYLVEDEPDEQVKERLLQSAHDIINYLKGHSERRIYGGHLVTVNVGNSQDFNHWKAGRDRDRERMKVKV